jgi:uncharacterized protein
MSKKRKPNADKMVAAIDRRDIELLRKLLAGGADQNAATNFSSSGNVTMLSYAAGCQFIEGVELLLKLGADPNISEVAGVTGEGGGATALHEAIIGDDIHAAEDDLAKRLKIVDLLLRAGAEPNAVRNKDELPLYFAARSGYLEICQRLIEGGAWVQNLPAGYMPPLFGAAYGFGHPEAQYEKIVNLLIEHGAPIDGETAWGATALMGAAFRASESLVNLFLERGANANRQAKDDGRTPLICAALYFRWDAFDEERQQRALRIVKRLLEAGADPTVRNNKGESALDIASRGKSPLVADYIRNVSRNKLGQ